MDITQLADKAKQITDILVAKDHYVKVANIPGLWKCEALYIKGTDRAGVYESAIYYRHPSGACSEISYDPAQDMLVVSPIKESDSRLHCAYQLQLAWF